MSKLQSKALKLFILLDVPHLKQAGGAEVHAYKLAQTLTHRDCEVKIIVPLPGAWSFHQEKVRGIQTLYFPVPIVKFRCLFWFMYSCEIFFFFLFRFDNPIIHLQGQRAVVAINLARYLSQKYATIKILSREHWQATFKPGLWNPVSKKIRLGFNRFITPSIELKQHLIANGIPQAKVIYIPNGTKILSITHKKESARAKLGLPVDKRIVIYTGVFYPRKNIPLLISAWEKIIKKNNNAFLVMLGDGPERPAIQNQVNNYGLQNSVSSRGYIPDVCEYLSSSDIFVLPSNIEGCSNALLEAMSCQCACIASDYPWNAEIIQHQVNGLLFFPNNAKMLADHLDRLLNDSALCKTLGEAAWHTIKNKFSLEATADMYYNLFQSMATNQ